MLSICSAERTVLRQRVCSRSFTAMALTHRSPTTSRYGPRVREDDGAVKPEVIYLSRPSNSLSFLILRYS